MIWDKIGNEEKNSGMGKKEREKYRDRIRGSLIGGAVGDALGYPIEFLTYKEITGKYSKDGLQNYVLEAESGEAVISDDTQMTLFTASGILEGDREGEKGRGRKSPSYYVGNAYEDWLITQTGRKKQYKGRSRLLEIPELWKRRAPGNTCLQAIASGRKGSIREPINNSKGCGGVMRVAPLGLHYGPVQDEAQRRELDREGAELAALTHGHPLGYLPAAILTHIINLGVYGGCKRGETLSDGIWDAVDAAKEVFGTGKDMEIQERLIMQAAEFAGNEKPDSENIPLLGGGWVAEETLAIAVYCSLRYQDDFTRALTASVNHSGDSDSTGAVTGNILGAWLGYGAIDDKWKKDLELRDVILKIADALC